MEEEKIQKLRQMDRALEQQAGMIDPKRYIGDIVMKNQIELLEQQVRELKWIIRAPCPCCPDSRNRKSVFEETAIPVVETFILYP